MVHDASFLAWCQHHNRSYLKRLVWMLIPGFVLWWPLDLILFRDLPEVFDAFLWMRLGALCVLLFYLVMEKWTNLTQQFAVGVPATGMILLSFWLPFCMGHAGDLSTPWFNWLYLGACAPIALFMPFSQKILLTLICEAVCYVGWYTARPDMFRDPALEYTLSCSAFAVCISLWIGEQLSQFARSKWQQEQKMDEKSKILNQQIEAQTGRLRTLALHLSSTQENERRRLSQELHDEFGQELAGIRYAIATLKRRYQNDTQLASGLQELEKQAAHLAETVRNTLLDLRPRVLEDLGLQAALEWLTDRVSRQGEIRIRFRNEGTELSIPHMLGLTIYRFVQEALTNILKHANAKNVTVELSWIEGNIHIKITDDGQGFDPTHPMKGMGILGMRERLLGLGGQLDILSSPGKGTTLEGVVPASAARMTVSTAEPVGEENDENLKI